MRKMLAFVLIMALVIPGMCACTYSEADASAGNLTIIYVADLHREAGRPVSELADFVTAVNNLHPDLILLGGDYGTEPDSSVIFFQELQNLHFHARYGVYAILGEADRVDYPEDPLELTKAMRSANIVPLVNRVDSIRLPSGTIRIAGLDDIICGMPDFGAIAGEVESSDYVIFLAHDPSTLGIARMTPDKNGMMDWIDLGLFGYAQMRDPDIEVTTGWVEENILFSDGTGSIYCIDISLQ